MKKLLTTIAIMMALTLTGKAQSYTGYITSDINLMDSTGEKVIKKCRKGDGILIYTLDVYKGGKYKIHHINGVKDGFISRKDVLLAQSVPYTALTMDEIKQAIRDTEMKRPMLKLFNNTSDKLSLKFGKEQITLAPKERMELRLEKGKYYYKLVMPGFDPYYGIERLEEHRMYDWEFYVGK